MQRPLPCKLSGNRSKCKDDRPPCPAENSARRPESQSGRGLARPASVRQDYARPRPGRERHDKLFRSRESRGSRPPRRADAGTRAGERPGGDRRGATPPGLVSGAARIGRPAAGAGAFPGGGERLAREAGRTSKAMLQFVLRDGFEACEEDVRENLAADAEFASGKNVTHKEAMRRARSAIGSGRGRTCAVDRGAAPPRRLRRHPSSMRRGESERELDCPISWV